MQTVQAQGLLSGSCLAFLFSFWQSLVSVTTESGEGGLMSIFNPTKYCFRVSGDKTDGSAAAQFAAFTTPVGLERDVRNVQEVFFFIFFAAI